MENNNLNVFKEFEVKATTKILGGCSTTAGGTMASGNYTYSSDETNCDTGGTRYWGPFEEVCEDDAEM